MDAFEKETLTIGTHDGEFHADEVLGIATCYIAFMDVNSTDRDIDIVRTRDPKVLNTCDMLVDVGSEYDPTEDKFDHHQLEGAGMRDNGIPYASFGLVWKKYGAMICEGSQEYASYVDEHLVQMIDAYDNGVELFTKTDVPNIHDLVPGLFIVNYNDIIGKTEDEKFGLAVAGAQFMIEGTIARAKKVCSNKTEITNALATATRPDIVVLPTIEGTRWQAHLPEASKDALFVVQPDSSGKRWAVRTVPELSNSVEMRASLPEQWRGIENETELRSITGVNNVQFVHPRGIFAATTEQSSALELAAKAVDLLAA